MVYKYETNLTLFPAVEVEQLLCMGSVITIGSLLYKVEDYISINWDTGIVKIALREILPISAKSVGK